MKTGLSHKRQQTKSANIDQAKKIKTIFGKTNISVTSKDGDILDLENKREFRRIRRFCCFFIVFFFFQIDQNHLKLRSFVCRSGCVLFMQSFAKYDCCSGFSGDLLILLSMRIVSLHNPKKQNCLFVLFLLLLLAFLLALKLFVGFRLILISRSTSYNHYIRTIGQFLFFFVSINSENDDEIYGYEEIDS